MVAAHMNLGGSLKSLGRLAEAEASYREKAEEKGGIAEDCEQENRPPEEDSEIAAKFGKAG